jgi:predicted DsbA family dithiol-disulfide isomerase
VGLDTHRFQQDLKEKLIKNKTKRDEKESKEDKKI